jgi:macrolide transport system ATP-binding/permease protein
MAGRWLIGDNGCGKSTLIKMIMDSEDGIKVAKGAKVGYFSQDMNILDDEKSILENVMDTSIYDETFTRTLLARLLFRKEDVYKKVSLLSGGERVKVSFAKLMLQDINILILDEPTNYLDINSMEIVEEALRAYNRTIFFVSHDRSFVRTIADHIMTIENKKIKIFNGNLDEYLKVINRVYDYNKERKEQEIFILENKLSEIIGKLSMPSKRDDVDHLDKEYQEILRKLKKLKC